MTPEFIAELKSTFAVPIKSFKYRTLDKSARVLSYGTINRRGDNVVASDISVEVDNTDLYFDDIIGTPTFNFGLSNKIEVDLSFTDLAETMQLFGGTLGGARFDGKNATLSIKDRFNSLMITTVGTDAAPVVYSNQNPADMVWSLLVTYGGLSSVTATTNPDIDYTSWSDWKTVLNGTGSVGYFRFSANLTGQTIGNILQSICNLSDSSIASGFNGKLRCVAKYNVLGVSSVDVYTESMKDGILVIDIDTSDIINTSQGFYGYNPSTGAWAGSYSWSNAASITNYGIFNEVIQDVNVWHYDSSSASTHMEILDIFKKYNPKRKVKLTSFLSGFTLNLYDNIYLYDTFHQAIDWTLIIEELSFNLDTFKVDITGFINY